MNRTWLRLSVSVLVLAALFYRVAPSEIFTVIARANPWLFLGAAFVYGLGQVASGIRWWTLARGAGFETPLAECVRIYFVSMFFGLAVPVSTLGTDGSRALYLGSQPPGHARAVSSVVFDRWIGLATLLAIAVAALLLGPSGELPHLLVMTLVALGTSLIGAWLMAPWLARFLAPGSRWRKLLEEDLVPYFRDRKVLGVASLLCLAVHGMQILAQKVLADALGLDIPLAFIAIYHPLIALASAIPITIGGFGLREAAYAYLLPHAGIAADDAVALALLWAAVSALNGLAGGLLFAIWRK